MVTSPEFQQYGSMCIEQDWLIQKAIESGDLKMIDYPLELYHLSPTPLDGRILTPRVPEYRLYDEDNQIERVCFSTSVKGAFRAIPGCNDVVMSYSKQSYVTMFVHIPVEDDGFWDDRIAIPSKSFVADSEYTGEVWIMKPVELICVAEIAIAFEGKVFEIGESQVLADILDIFDSKVFPEDILWNTYSLFDAYPDAYPNEDLS